jgi:RNA 3'-terminal phosphate cyclase (ATP)
MARSPKSRSKAVMVDGAQGEGGGQILRTSLSLSVCTQKKVVVERIRARRRKPGLLRQHLTALKAAAKISGARVEGGELGSKKISFAPKKVRAGDYHFKVGSAGSACLVLQAVLPPLLFADGPSTVVVEGGTHNPLAPPFDFLTQSFFSCLRRMGVDVRGRLLRHGFFPAGGGKFEVSISPTKSWRAFESAEKGELLEKEIRILAAHLPQEVAEKEARFLTEKLGWDKEAVKTESIGESLGPGNAILVRLRHGEHDSVFSAFGQRGIPAPRVLSPLVKEVQAFLNGRGSICVHLADQLLLPMVLGGGGVFTTVGLSEHFRTNVDVIGQFVDTKIRTERRARSDMRVNVR